MNYLAHSRDRAGLAAASVAAVIGLVLMVSGSTEVPAAEAGLSHRTQAYSLGDTAEGLLLDHLEHELGSFVAPQVPEDWQALFPGDGDLSVRLAEGRRQYALNCQHCHGGGGDAQTQTASILMPRPRDFSLGLVKFKSTPGNLAPLREDLERILREGAPSTAMASFAHLDEEQLHVLVDYVQYLLMRGSTETKVAAALAVLSEQGDQDLTDPAAVEFTLLESISLALEAVGSDWRNAPAHRLTAEPGESSAEAIARGEKLFHSSKANCTLCHGTDGRGRGPAAWADEHGWLLRDAWGNPIRPADFGYGSFHGGAQPEDIYRSIALGVAGTPMAGYRDTLTAEEIADLTHYLHSLTQ